MSTLKERIVEQLRRDGIDIVRFGDAARFKDPNVKILMPEAKTVVCAAARQLRGARRLVEEGTAYHHFSTVGLETLEETVLPFALLRACNILEDAGYDALPQRRNQLVMAEEDGTNPEMVYGKIYRGKTAEHQLDFEQCAVDAGLGERGLHGTILTEEFGPFQRYAFVITDAEIEPDPVPEPKLCDKCGECVKACPGHAIAPDGKLDRWRCAVYYVGANASKNPFLPTSYAYADEPDRTAIMNGDAVFDSKRARKIIDQTNFCLPIRHAYCASICAKACDTECYVHLEKKGVLKKKFASQFRKRPRWSLPVDGQPFEKRSERTVNGNE